MRYIKKIFRDLFIEPNLYLVKRILIVTIILGGFAGITNLNQTWFIIIPLIGVAYFVYLTLRTILTLIYLSIKELWRKLFKK